MRGRAGRRAIARCRRKQGAFCRRTCARRLLVGLDESLEQMCENLCGVVPPPRPLSDSDYLDEASATGANLTLQQKALIHRRKPIPWRVLHRPHASPDFSWTSNFFNGPRHNYNFFSSGWTPPRV